MVDVNKMGINSFGDGFECIWCTTNDDRGVHATDTDIAYYFVFIYLKFLRVAEKCKWQTYI